MGNSCLRKPLPFSPGEQFLGSELYRLTKFDQEWRLDVKSSDGWFSLYQFHHKPVSQDAIVEAHQNIYLTPKSLAIRDDKRITGKTNDEKRKVVAWFPSTNKGFFKSQKSTGESKEQQLENFNEASVLAEKKFGFPF